MTFKFSHFISPILLSILLIIGCANKEKNGDLASVIDDSAYPVMRPSVVKYPPLDSNYVRGKRCAIENFCDKYWKNEANNFSFLVAKNGQVIYERYQGMANREKKIPITRETPMHIASVSKVLTATAIMLLVDRKEIELDQKVNTILVGFPYPKITVKHLLSHRSGLRNYAYFTEDKGVWDRHKMLSNQDILNLFSEKNIKLESPTDTRFAYCNTNYAMLALMIEKKTGMKYADAMQQMIFKPLGMNHTYVFDYDKDKATATPSYKASNMKLALDYLDEVYGDKNIYSTPRDMLQFELARNAPTFLNPLLKSQIYAGYSNERKGEKNYGLGIRMINWNSGQNFYFHNGWWHGNTSAYIELNRENVTIIALSNKFNRNTYAVRKLATLFGDYPIKMDKGEKLE